MNLESSRNFARHPLSATDSTMLAPFLTCCGLECSPCMHPSLPRQCAASLTRAFPQTKSLPSDRMV